MRLWVLASRARTRLRKATASACWVSAENRRLA